MDFRDRLLKNDIRCLGDNVKAISDELEILREFIEYQFGPKFNAFLRSREASSVSKKYVISGISSFPRKNQEGRLKPRKKLDKKAVDDESDSEVEVSEDEKSERATKKRSSERASVPFIQLKKSKPDDEVAADDDLNEFAVSDADAKSDDGNEDDSFIFPDNTAFEIKDNETEDDLDAPNTSKSKMNISKKPVSTEALKQLGLKSKKNNIDNDDSENGDYENDPDFDPSCESKVTVKKQYRALKKTNLKLSDFEVGPKKEVKPVDCPVCNKSVPKNDLGKHVQQTHDKEETESLLVCYRCGLQCTTDKWFNAHQKKLCVRQCSYCPKVLSDKIKHIEHERTHTGEKPYACPLCPNAYAKKCNLTRHFKSHSTKS